MSPTIFKYRRYRFYFLSLEEKRMHVHVQSAEGEAKFWLEPMVALADRYGLKTQQLREIQKIVETHRDEIERAWKKFFKS